MVEGDGLKKVLGGEVPEECMSVLEKFLRNCVMDPYLGIPNRLYFEVFGKREIELARRLNSSISILFIDVDGLKEVNDTLGHVAGDIYLREIVKLVKASLRSCDLLVRWGGDEFLSLLYTDERGARIAKERVENTVNSAVVLIGSKEVRCGISVGWAEVTNSLLSAIAIADARMYEEKKKKVRRRLGGVSDEKSI